MVAPTRYGVVTERGLAPLGAAAHPAAPREPKSRPCQSAALRAGEASGLLTQQGGDATAGTNASTRFLGLPYGCLQEETPPRAFVASQRFRAAPRSRRWSTVTAGGASGSVLPRVFFSGCNSHAHGFAEGWAGSVRSCGPASAPLPCRRLAGPGCAAEPHSSKGGLRNRWGSHPRLRGFQPWPHWGLR